MKPHAIIDLSLSTDEEEHIPLNQQGTVLSERNGFKHRSSGGLETSPVLPLYEGHTSIKVIVTV